MKKVLRIHTDTDSEIIFRFTSILKLYMSPHLTRMNLYNLLLWQKEAGADDALEGSPSNHLLPADVRKSPEDSRILSNTVSAYPPSPGTYTGRSPSSPKMLPQATSVLPLPPAINIHINNHQNNIWRLVETAQTMEELEKALSQFEGCHLKDTATNTCFADGNPKARIMFIGEAPGREEDIQGKPFVGRAGQLLDKMMQSIDLTRKDVFITNTVFWRPPGNRNPTPAESAICRPFTERQIELVAPDILIFLGGISAKHMLKTNEGIMKLRGKWYKYYQNDLCIPAIATLHPAYLLRQPSQKSLAWRDFLEIKIAFKKSQEK